MSLPPSRAERRFERQITKSCPSDNIRHNMHVHVRLTPQCPQTTSCSQHEGRLQTMIEKPSNEALQLHACVIIHTHISIKIMAECESLEGGRWWVASSLSYERGRRVGSNTHQCPLVLPKNEVGEKGVSTSQKISANPTMTRTTRPGVRCQSCTRRNPW